MLQIRRIASSSSYSSSLIKLRTIIITLILTILTTNSQCGPVFTTREERMSSFTYPLLEVFEVKRQSVNSVIYTNTHPKDHKSSSIREINVTRNSDLLFGEVTEQDSALLLECEAPYSVQWIYKGDGDPEFNTNTTTEMDYSTGKRMYNAYLYLGMRNTLTERETGKYICSSVRNKNLFSFVYIYVTKATLFTNKGLETVHYSRNDDTVRIPCSLSDPRASTTLQKKSRDGVLQCPMNDTVRFDPKQGFTLNINRLHQPEGTYLCIADYNNKLQIIKYDVMQLGDGGQHGLPSDQHSEEFPQLPGADNEASEFEPGHWTTPPPSQTSSPSPAEPMPSNPPLTCINARITCGLNAFCHTDHNGGERCRCFDGFSGNPYVECRPKEEMSSTTKPPDGTCTSYDHCPFDQACYQNKCVDPCVVRPICGPHTTCTTQHNMPICECLDGYDGDPYSSQDGQRCEKKSHCDPNPCGPNTVCKYVNGIISCSCESGYATHHDGVCRPSQKQDFNLPGTSTTGATTTTATTIPSTSRTTTTNAPPKIKPVHIIQMQGQSKNPLPRPFRNRTSPFPFPITATATTAEPSSPTTLNRVPFPPRVSKLPPRKTISNVIVVSTPLPPEKECHYDVDCPDDRMCVRDQCQDPCVNACGFGARCTTRGHFPRCACPKGTSGDPFYKCSPVFAGTGSNAPDSSLSPPFNLGGNSNGGGMNEEKHHYNCGGRHSPCGPNSVCQMSRNKFVCACVNGDIGDPYSNRGCFSEIGYRKCSKDDDCPHFLTCLRNKGCMNPCNVHHICPPGRSCVPYLHKPACLKTKNFEVELPRDGLGDLDEEPIHDELEPNEIPKEEEGSACFIRREGGFMSPCGRNTVCYDENKNGTEPFCGCLNGFVGDPWIGCDPVQKCKNHSECGMNEACLNGHCKLGLEDNKTRTTNPCSPSPCKTPTDKCAIVRRTNTAECIPQGRRLSEEELPSPSQQLRKPTRYLSRSDLCVLTGECEEFDDDDAAAQNEENFATTELASGDSDFVQIISSTTGASSSSSISSSSSLEENDTQENIDFLLNYSNATTPVSHASTVIDA